MAGVTRVTETTRATGTTRTSRAGSNGVLRAARRLWQAGSMRLNVRGDVLVGDRFRLGQGSVISSPHGLRVGHDVSVGRNCTLEVSGTIGSFVLISAQVGIVGRRDHAIEETGTPMRYSTWVGDRPCEPADLVRIEDDVWIGYGACILSGLHIGTGAVVAAGSVVVHDVAPYAIVAGNPARTVGHRRASAQRGLAR